MYVCVEWESRRWLSLHTHGWLQFIREASAFLLHSLLSNHQIILVSSRFSAFASLTLSQAPLHWPVWHKARVMECLVVVFCVFSADYIIFQTPTQILLVTQPVCHPRNLRGTSTGKHLRFVYSKKQAYFLFIYFCFSVPLPFNMPPTQLRVVSKEILLSISNKYTVDRRNNYHQQLHKNAASNIEQVLEATPHKAAAIRPPTTHHENYPN